MARAKLRIYLGAAPGVGKTFAMLNEGFRRHERGTDVVVGYVETHNRSNTEVQLRDLEVIPRKAVDYRGTTLQEMDTEAIIARRPDVALVDELAHTNAPGSTHRKRWEDVEEILEAGIDVISTLNIQHLESLNDVVERITGVKQRETIPDEVARAADQVELIDMTPEALRRRMAHGNIYAPEKVDAALGNYFRVGNLGALRELALMWVADKVEEALQDYKVHHGIEDTWETRERVVVALTGAPSGEQLIRRAARMAMRARGELIGVHITPSDGLAAAPADRLEVDRQLLEDLGGTYHEIVGSDVARTLADFARTENATQLVLGASRRSRWSELTGGSIVNHVLRQAGSLDVHVISHPAVESESGRVLPSRSSLPTLSRRRQLAGWAVSCAGLPLLTVGLANLRDQLTLPSQLLLYLLLVVVSAGVGGAGPAALAAVGGSLLVNWYFTPPIYEFTVADAENALALFIFLVVGAVVSFLVIQSAGRAASASRSRGEVEALARAAAELAASDDPLPPMLERLRVTFGLTAVAVYARSPEGGWFVEASSGTGVPPVPSDDGSTLQLAGDAVLLLQGRSLTGEDRRIAHALGAQLVSALERRRLREDAAAAALLAEADQLRTALLRAVSHDLRTPLASIKASVTSLLQRDVDWTPEAISEFLETIDEESDRLNLLVGNLLDMSRLQSGALRVELKPVGFEDLVPAALASLSGPTSCVDVDVDESLPRVEADAALLERVVANVASNAIAATPDGERVRIEAGVVGSRVHLRVVDRGAGIPVDDRERIFEPFQRMGDSAAGGVGLGLAVAKGFVDAMDGELTVEDTPSGGLTVVVSLRRAEER